MSTRFVSFVRLILGFWALQGCASAAPLPPAALALNDSGARAAAEGDATTAEARLSLALEYNPRFTEAWVNLGLVELRRGNLETAEKHFDRARDLNADLPTPHHGLGLVADRRGKAEDAERHYRDALEVDPGFAPARINLARRLHARRAFDQARLEFLRVTQVAPQEASAYVGLAAALEQLGRTQEAYDVVTRARTRFQDAPDLALLAGHFHVLRQEWSDAQRVLGPLSVADDRSIAAPALAHLALVFLQRGELDRARAANAKALDLDRDEPLARATRGELASVNGTANK